MKHAVLKKAHPLFTQQVDAPAIPVEKEEYLFRLDMLRRRMADDGMDVTVVYGDREHFGNISYLSGYDCRFEESLLIVPREGVPTILVGNEGMAYAMKIPYEIQRVFYRHFSLQGQPWKVEEKLPQLLQAAGVSGKVGLCGLKYWDAAYCDGDPDTVFDVPAYIVDAIRSVSDTVVNYTAVFTGLDGGMRLRVWSAKEIARAEAAACRSANVVLNMLEALRPGADAYEVSRRSLCGFEPVTMYPLVNFGPQAVSYGVDSPVAGKKLQVGDPCGLCYGIRGSLTSRVGVAAYDEASMGAYRPYLFNFYGKFFEAMCSWYSKLRVGADGHTLHRAVHDLIGGEEYHVALNAGHYTCDGEEWTNALSYEGSRHTLPDGAYLQVDIIASNPDPVRTAICEDTAIVAGPELRAQLEKEYPQVYRRIMERRRVMQEVLGISLEQDVLPLSNLNGAMFPFLLNLDTVFALQD